MLLNKSVLLFLYWSLVRSRPRRSGELLGIVTNNLREKSGHLIPTLNFTLPLRRLQPILRYVSGGATGIAAVSSALTLRSAAVLEELEELSDREGRIWRLEVAVACPVPFPHSLLQCQAQLSAAFRLGRLRLL